jgi:hypothetical protein
MLRILGNGEAGVPDRAAPADAGVADECMAPAVHSMMRDGIAYGAGDFRAYPVPQQ